MQRWLRVPNYTGQYCGVVRGELGGRRCVEEGEGTTMPLVPRRPSNPGAEMNAQAPTRKSRLRGRRCMWTVDTTEEAAW